MPRDVNGEPDKGEEQAQSSSLAGDLWQSAKYSLVQESYNGLAQLGNGMGAQIKQRHLVDKPATAQDTSHQVAQDVGAIAGKVPLVVAAYGLTGSGMRKFINSVGLPASEASLARLSVSAALVGGLTSETEGKNLPYERAKMAALGGLSVYAIGKTQEKLVGASGLLESSSQSLLSQVGRHAGIIGINAAVGTGAGAIYTEADSLAINHRHATAIDLKRNIGTSLAMSLAVGATFRPRLMELEKQPATLNGLGTEHSQIFPANDLMKVPDLGEQKVDPHFKLPPRSQ